MAKCGACGKFLKPSSAITCTCCPLMFHRGCIAIPEYSKVSKTLICLECKKKECKVNSSFLPAKNICSADPPPNTVTVLTAASSQCDVTSSPENISDVRAMRQEIAEYMRELREFHNEMVAFRASVAVMGQRLDGIEHRLEVLEQANLKSEVKDSLQLENTVEQLKTQINERDQDALLSDLELRCLPELKGEDLSDTIIALSAKLGVHVEKRDIVFVNRIGTMSSCNVSATDANGTETSKERPRSVVVRLARQQLRDGLLQAAKSCRNLLSTDIGLAGPPRRFYVNERLTRTNRQLFYLVRNECRKRNWRYSWTRRGRIFARQAGGTHYFRIRSHSDLMSVFVTEDIRTDQI